MNIIGISALYHDSAACLLQSGKITAAAQEERFSRKKHDPSFPRRAISFCLESQNLKVNDIDYMVFYDKPLLKLERLLETYLCYAPLGIRSFSKAVPLWLKEKLWLKNLIHSDLEFEGKILFTEHHQAHAASAFYPSPYKEAAFLTLDGVGEWATASFGIGEENKITISSELHFPHSIGLLYSAFTYYLGFKVNFGEYKVMGLAPFGKPSYKNLILSELIDLKEDGSFRLNMKYFNYCAGLTMTTRKFSKLFGSPPRNPDTPISQRHMDLACSVQKVTEEIIGRMAKHVFKVSGKNKLCLAGGVALNCVSNGKLLREGPFKEIWVQPAASDAGGALGAALFVWYQHLKNKRNTDEINDSQQGSLLGPEYSDSYIKNYLDSKNIKYKRLAKADIVKKAGDLIAGQKIIGWFQGKMEFGPRALGNRSILADARSVNMQQKINAKIKFRESFRPFAPSVLAEKSEEYFNFSTHSDYMLFTAPVAENMRKEISKEEEHLSGTDKVKAARSCIPAVTHLDYSSRIHTVNKKTNPLFYELLKYFDENYSCPLVLNTSFNLRGEPMVCSPQDAYSCFIRSGLDALFMGSFLIQKDKNMPKDNR